MGMHGFKFRAFLVLLECCIYNCVQLDSEWTKTITRDPDPALITWEIWIVDAGLDLCFDPVPLIQQ
jgi:hypothetical protein